MINLSKKQWGGALLVSLLALSLALAGCSEPEVVGSDITGRWAYSSTEFSFECTFNSDGTCSAESSTMSMGVEGSWSLNGTTVAIDASGSFMGEDVSVTQTYTYNDDTKTLVEKSTTITDADGETQTMSLGLTLIRQ